MHRIALIGRDIKYTQSPEVHAAIGSSVGEEISLDVLDVPFDGLERTVKESIQTYDGFFITKPYKTEVAKILTGNSEPVNVVRSRDNAAFNTDGAGFIRALDRNFNGWRSKVNGALVLGAGGAALSVASELTALGKKTYVLNRTLKHALRLCAQTGAELYVNQPAELIVNCTTLGWRGEDVLRALCVLPDFDFAFDTVYNGDGTPFLRRCGANGGAIADGFDMLLYQAIEGDKLLFGWSADAEEIYGKAKQILTEK